MPSTASSSSSGSASPEPEISASKKGKSKAAEKTKSANQLKARNEGDDPNWAYVPPRKSTRLEASADMGDADWDALSSNPDLELWLVRIPDGVKPKYLESAQVEPPKRGSTKSAKLGMLQRKHVAYDIWSLGDDEPAELPFGGDEVKALSGLLPRKSKKGKLYDVPTPIARTIVLSAQAVKPTPDSSAANFPNAPSVYKNPPRERYPSELLTHKFMPCGSLVGEGDRVGTPAALEVDGEVLVPDTPVKTKSESKKPKGKKRKGEGDAVDGEPPKKTKKVKTAS
ncbi:hypothetical protein B0H15DRAFT_383168 [Mycena belliarum]|uniref:Uncharacterized protein n=1 Tax=Mycena belliarum TaxID=1033014 RepID=A0AAD6XQ07_9AGAR|nr:hypothetical protein B0H15DRAFT_383168 [Mycena belliae]